MEAIVILTKKFGLNFTGATIATQMLINEWCKYVKMVYVVTLNVGEYIKHDNLNVYPVKSHNAIIELIQKLALRYDKTVYYSDDHLGYLLHKAGKKYLHTYHGNWPDAKYISPVFFMKSFYFIHCYKETIGNATVVVNVSKYMEKFTKRYNENSILIRNGIFWRMDKKAAYKSNTYDCIMVGNVDNRKYKNLYPMATAARFSLSSGGVAVISFVSSLITMC